MKLHLTSLLSSLLLRASTSTALAVTSNTDCRNTLSCSFAELETMTMSTRLAYMKTLQSNFFAPLNAGNQFAAIEGIITFFMQNDLGKPNSWASYVDAGIVEGIQNGGANALGLHTEDGGNPGTAPWKQFLLSMKSGAYTNRDAHDKGWSVAEQTSTDYGKGVADVRFSETEQEKRWYLFTQLFRLIMRNHNKTVDACKAAALANPLTWAFVPKCEDLVNWLSDITDIEPTLCLSKTVWDLVDPGTSVLELPWVFGRILGELIRCFEET